MKKKEQLRPWLLLPAVVSSIVVALLSAASIGGGEVTYDGRSLVVDGQRKMLFSGSIHYPRSTPEMWGDLIGKAKQGGIDVIQTYVFWNLHEPQPGQYDFSGRNDLVRFIKEIQAQGLYACLRIGPFIESEWNYGGFPFWLHDVPGIVYRTNNEPFKFYMQNFTTKIVNLMKSESLFASQGGPIILSQIENEYQNVEKAFGSDGLLYVDWAAKMAVGLETGVPWVMCKQQDAPDPVINSCNGMRCGETFAGPNSPNKPSIWTEDWTSFYQVFGGEPYIRPEQDIAFHAALFIARLNGSYINYYMYHGGTNFGRTSSAYMITGYYDQAPLDEYGLLRQPKWGHLKDLHAAIKRCSGPLLYGNKSVISIGQLQEAYVFEEETGGCVAFLLNNDKRNAASVQFRNESFNLLPKSITILEDCKSEIFNTAAVASVNSTRIFMTNQVFDTAQWEEFAEPTPNYCESLLRSDVLLEQTNTTKDISDYLWYTFSFKPDSACTGPTLQVQSTAHVAHAFVNGTSISTAHGNHDAKSFKMDVPFEFSEEMTNISILSVMVGLPDSGAFLESRYSGLTQVGIQCSPDEPSYNLTNYSWGYQVGLLGEKLQIYLEENLNEVVWSEATSPNQSLIWYKTSFDAPKGDEPLVLNLSSMAKGEAWINGQSIGRYWVSFLMTEGQPSQSLYHVPRSFLNDGSEPNLLVLLEEIGGDPSQISLEIVSTSTSTYISPSSVK
ncbi:hypothetical protein MLD38_028408 [Melastoma candidum]|uniref:Uncharacterized protein n=1 Tax=Melastoma candidum TaxID=119954 RepID=A0ACB9N2J2_9MYRT|nr:hypothetical protein MLD38_028408 [Melastoma candidum]